MADTTKEIAGALQESQGDAGYYQKSQITYQEKVRGMGDLGLNAVADSLHAKNEESVRQQCWTWRTAIQ